MLSPPQRGIKVKANIAISIFNGFLLLFLAFRVGTPLLNVSDSILANTDSIGVFLMAQANQFALMQVILSALGIGLAVIGFWGYFAIKSSAESKAEATVREEVPKLFDEVLKKYGREELQRLILETKMELAEEKNSSDVFQEGIERIFDDSLEMPHD